MDKKQIIDEIKEFLDGGNDLSYVVNVETNAETNKGAVFIHEPNKNKEVRMVEYTPFIYIKDLKKQGLRLYNGNQTMTEIKMKKYGISIKEMKTGNHAKLKNGYKYKVTSNVSYVAILTFFKEGGVDPYDKLKTDSGKVVRDKDGKPVFRFRTNFYMPKLSEQFFISTGIRLFKGFEEYNDIHKVTFDIETTGLRYQHSRVFSIGIRDNKGFECVLEVKKDDDNEEEKQLIKQFFHVITTLKPAVIIGYNSEDFDFTYILGRAELLGIELDKIRTTFSETHNIRKTKSQVKIGNSSEDYMATVIWGASVLDILHAVKKTAVLNTEIKNNKLKYICQYEDIAKPDRMYITGDGIGRLWKENAYHIINPENNNYHKIPRDYDDASYKLLLLQKGKEKLSDEQYTLVKKRIFNDNQEFVTWLRENVGKILNGKGDVKITTGKDILRRYNLDDIWETEQVDNLYNQSTFMVAKLLPATYSRVATMGGAGVWNLLMTAWSYENDLAIPYPDNKEGFSGGLSRCYRQGYVKRLIKIDYASLYPMLQLTYDIFPYFDIDHVIKKMLMYLTTTRNIYKKLAISEDINEEEIALLKLTDPETYTKFINNTLTDKDRRMFKVKQLPIKILNNSLFGALGSAYAFNWSDNICAARITCAGRLFLRRAVKYFAKYDCVPLLAVTDGINFSVPDKTNIRVTDDSITEGVSEGVIEEMWTYKGKTGIAALIAKYNAEEMPSEYMSVDNDGEFVSCYNLYRINYALMQEYVDKKTGETKTKIKLTGNSIKSKTMPEYIEDFYNEGIKLILEGKGKDFIDYYYDYAENIFYREISLKKIASKSKFKMSLKDYLNRGKDKNGKQKASQAHMELIYADRKRMAREIFDERFDEFKDKNPDKIYDDYTDEEILKIVDTYLPPEPDLDSTVYYVNTGKRKSHGDVKKVKIKDELGIITGEEVILQAQLINMDELEKNPDFTLEYNTEKYLEAFNKKVEILINGFTEEVRSKLLVKVVREKVKDVSGKKIEQILLKKESFFENELQLGNFELDNLEESMFLEDKEIEFWNKSGFDPTIIWKDFNRHDGDLTPEIYDFALNYVSEKMVASGKPRVKSVNDKILEGDFILIKTFEGYDLGCHNGKFIEIVRENIDVPKSPKEIEMDMSFIDEENTIKKLQEMDDKFYEEPKPVNYPVQEYKAFAEKYGIPDTLTYEMVMEDENTRIVFDNFLYDLRQEREQYELIDEEDV